jgi:hypothetical protein
MYEQSRFNITPFYEKVFKSLQQLQKRNFFQNETNNETQAEDV